MRELKIGTSWVRGVVGDALTPELAVDFACAFGTWATGDLVVIGRDTRRSSPMFRSAVLAGLFSTGCDVVDLGVCTTPLVSFAVRELGATGAISITGSHNDSQWNALKFLGPDGALLNSVKGEELLDIYHAKSFRRAGSVTRGPVGEVPDLAARYLEHLISGLDSAAIRRRGFTVAVDFCNGAAVGLARGFLEAVGCKLQAVNPEPRGEFVHPPAPSIASMSQLSANLAENGADLGAALNIDGDRIGFVTAKGQALSEEHTLPLAARNRLQRRPGPVVTNLSTSRMIDEVAAHFSQTVTRTAVGESSVLDAGLEIEAVLAGEGSGGVAVLPASTTFDALMTLGLILEAMASSGRTLTELVDELPRFFVRKGEIRCAPARAYRAVEACRAAYAEQSPDLSDGVRVDWDDAWAHVRVSTTEPLLRLIVEASREDRARSLFEKVEQIASRAIQDGE